MYAVAWLGKPGQMVSLKLIPETADLEIGITRKIIIFILYLFMLIKLAGK